MPYTLPLISKELGHNLLVNWKPKSTQGLCFELSDALACDIFFLAYILQGADGAAIQSISPNDDNTLAFRQRKDRFRQFLARRPAVSRRWGDTAIVDRRFACKRIRDCGRMGRSQVRQNGGVPSPRGLQERRDLFCRFIDRFRPTLCWSTRRDFVTAQVRAATGSRQAERGAQSGRVGGQGLEQIPALFSGR